jgi:uncharacterized protein (DUF169 family)
MTTLSATDEWAELSARLTKALHLSAPPVFLSFDGQVPSGVASFPGEMSEPASDGRAGLLSASCVFWMEAAAADDAFVTVAADHGNCSVGLLTHGLATLEEVAGNGDVAALLASGWVTEEAVAGIPTVAERPEAITYGRLDTVPADLEPDVIVLRVNGRQLMVLSDSAPEMRIEGKPQCHIIAVAKQEGVPAASVGCALSRARTGMRPEEMTCALPAAGLGDLVGRIEATAATDSVVAKYAADDARRFSPRSN